MVQTPFALYFPIYIKLKARDRKQSPACHGEDKHDMIESETPKLYLDLFRLQLHKFTLQEVKALQEVLDGESAAKRIALKLNKQPTTVKQYFSRIRDKMEDLGNRRTMKGGLIGELMSLNLAYQYPMKKRQ